MADWISTALIVGSNLVAILGAAVLVFHRVKPISGWGQGLTGLWWLVCGLGVVALLILIYRIGFNRANSGEDRMMQSLLLLAFGPVCLAAAIAAFVKPR